MAAPLLPSGLYRRPRIPALTGGPVSAPPAGLRGRPHRPERGPMATGGARGARPCGALTAWLHRRSGIGNGQKPCYLTLPRRFVLFVHRNYSTPPVGEQAFGGGGVSSRVRGKAWRGSAAALGRRPGATGRTRRLGAQRGAARVILINCTDLWGTGRAIFAVPGPPPGPIIPLGVSRQGQRGRKGPLRAAIQA